MPTAMHMQTYHRLYYKFYSYNNSVAYSYERFSSNLFEAIIHSHQERNLSFNFMTLQLYKLS